MKLKALVARFALMGALTATHVQANEMDYSSIISNLKGMGAGQSELGHLLDEKTAIALTEKLKRSVEQLNAPKIDLSIRFDLASSEPLKEYIPMLDVIAGALSSPELSQSIFLIAGHTDLSGTPESNLELSNQRANWIKDYFVREHQINPARLIAIGFGSEKLKNTANPNSLENRRVEIVNLSDSVLDEAVMPNMSLIVVVEDTDDNAIKRNHEISKRFVSRLEQQLFSHHVSVLDEDIVATRLGVQLKSSRTRQAIMNTLFVANNAAHPDIQSRFALVVSIFPNIQEMTTTRRISMRVRGQLYDLERNQALSSVESSTPVPISIPKSDMICNAICVDEKVGDVAVALAEMVGNSLAQSITAIISKELGIEEIGAGMLEYTLTLSGLERPMIMAVNEDFLTRDYIEFEMISSSSEGRVYLITTPKAFQYLNNELQALTDELGINRESITLDIKR